MKNIKEAIRIEDMAIKQYQGNNDLQLCYNLTRNKITVILPEGINPDKGADETMRAHFTVMRAHFTVLLNQGYSNRQIKKILKKQYTVKEHDRHVRPFWEYE